MPMTQKMVLANSTKLSFCSFSLTLAAVYELVPFLV